MADNQLPEPNPVDSFGNPISPQAPPNSIAAAPGLFQPESGLQPDYISLSNAPTDTKYNPASGVSVLPQTDAQKLLDNAPVTGLANPETSPLLSPTAYATAARDTLNQLGQTGYLGSNMPESIAKANKIIGPATGLIGGAPAPTPDPSQYSGGKTPSVLGGPDLGSLIPQNMAAKIAENTAKQYQSIGAARAQTAKSEAEAYKAQSQVLQDQATAEATRQKNFEAASNNWQVKSDALAKQISESNPKLQDYWANKSTGSKILAAIAVGLGQYSSAINGGPNNALAIINKAVDDDVAKQKYNYEQGLHNKKMLLDNTNTLYGRAMQTFNDQTIALNYAKQIAHEQVSNKIAQITATGAAKEAGPTAAILANGQKQLADQYRQAQQQQLAKVAWLSGLGANGKGGPNDLAKLTPAQLASAEAAGYITKEQATAVKDQQARTVPGTDIVAPTMSQQQELTKDIGKATQSAKDLQELYDMVTSPKFTTLSADDRAEARAKAEMTLEGLQSQLTGAGLLTKYKAESIRKIIGDQGEFFKLQSDKSRQGQLLALKNTLTKNINEKIRQYGGKGTFNPQSFKQDE